MGHRGPLCSLAAQSLCPYPTQCLTHSLPAPAVSTSASRGELLEGDEQMESSDPGPYSQPRGPGPERGPQGGRVPSARYPGLPLLGPHPRTVCGPLPSSNTTRNARARAHALSHAHTCPHTQKYTKGKPVIKPLFSQTLPGPSTGARDPPSTRLKGTGAPTLSWPWPRGGTSSRVDQARSAWC